MKAQLTQAGIKKMALAWYKHLDVHSPIVEVFPLLAEKGLQMKFPEATVKGLAGFEGWYERVIRVFFDEIHRVRKVKAAIRGNRAKVKVIVHWEASFWNPPEGYSKRIVAEAYQTWEVRLNRKTGLPVIQTYCVDRMKLAKGSAKL